MRRNIHKAHRHTIMSGRVVTYAPSFMEIDGVFGKQYEPFGEFSISVSRDSVIIEAGDFRNPEDIRYFKQVLDLAHKQFIYLKKSQGRPKDSWDGSPIKIHLK